MDDAYSREMHHLSAKSTPVDLSSFEVEKVGDIGRHKLPCGIHILLFMISTRTLGCSHIT